jgi:putative endonuclease
MAFCYILECSDGSYYVGSTKNLERRVWERNHSPSAAAYTRRRRPVSLVWAGEFESIGEAFTFEKQVQGWRRTKRQALIAGTSPRSRTSRADVGDPSSPGDRQGSVSRRALTALLNQRSDFDHDARADYERRTTGS